MIDNNRRKRYVWRKMKKGASLDEEPVPIKPLARELAQETGWRPTTFYIQILKELNELESSGGIPEHVGAYKSGGSWYVFRKKFEKWIRGKPPGPNYGILPVPNTDSVQELIDRLEPKSPYLLAEVLGRLKPVTFDYNKIVYQLMKRETKGENTRETIGVWRKNNQIVVSFAIFFRWFKSHEPRGRYDF